MKDIPPMFQILQFFKMTRRLRLVVDSASPITCVNFKTWEHLDKPKLQPITRVLSAFEGQPIHPIGYFSTDISYENHPQKMVILPIYVSHNGINILGWDRLAQLNISENLLQF